MMRNLWFLIFTILTCNVNSQLKWNRISNGMINYNTLSLTKLEFEKKTIIFAGTDKGGVYKSIDLGNSWLETPSHKKFTGTQTWCLATIDTFVFAGQRFGGVLRSSVNGTTWEEVNVGLTNNGVQDIISIGSTLFVATYGGGVFTSTDLGNHWVSLYANAGLDDLFGYALAFNSTDLYYGSAGRNTTMPDTGVAWFSTIQNGQYWEKRNNGFIRNGAHFEQVFSMDANDSLVFAGTDDVGLFRSMDKGLHWQQVHNSADVHSIKIAGPLVYYGTSFGGIFTSQDFGKTFSTNVVGLAFGNSTIPFLVKDFIIEGNEIFAATDIGVFKQTLPIISKINPTDYSNSDLIKLFPNPTFQNEVNLEIPVHLYPIKVIFMDLFGRIAKVKIINKNDSGKININDLNSGTYIVNLIDPNFNQLEVKRLIILD